MTLLGSFLADFGVPLGILLGAFGQLFDEPFLEAFSGGCGRVREGTVRPRWRNSLALAGEGDP